MKHTIRIRIETKKGVIQDTLWLVTQQRPHPDIDGGCRLSWRGAGGVLAAYGRPAEGLEKKYSIALLREGWTEETAEDSRKDCAGFVPYQETVATPGAIAFRGKSLGETTAEVSLGQLESVCCWRVRGGESVCWRVRGGDTPSSSERELLKAQVEPGLMAFIKASADSLKADAIAGLRAGVEATLASARTELDKMQAEMAAAIAKL